MGKNIEKVIRLNQKEQVLCQSSFFNLSMFVQFLFFITIKYLLNTPVKVVQKLNYFKKCNGFYNFEFSRHFLLPR